MPASRKATGHYCGFKPSLAANKVSWSCLNSLRLARKSLECWGAQRPGSPVPTPSRRLALRATSNSDSSFNHIPRPWSTVPCTISSPLQDLASPTNYPAVGLFVSPIPFSGELSCVSSLGVSLVFSPLFSPPLRFRSLPFASSVFPLPDKIFDLAKFVGQKVAVYHAFRALITSFDPPGLAVMRLGTDSLPNI